MKFVFMTEPDNNGISDVFHMVILTPETAPQEMIDRWIEISNASPITPLIVSGKENVAARSTWDPESESFSLEEGTPAEAARPLTEKIVTFLINNTLKGLIALPVTGAHSQLLEAGFSGPVKINMLEDSSPVIPGYTWNGTEFTAPA